MKEYRPIRGVRVGEWAVVKRQGLHWSIGGDSYCRRDASRRAGRRLVLVPQRQLLRHSRRWYVWKVFRLPRKTQRQKAAPRNGLFLANQAISNRGPFL